MTKLSNHSTLIAGAVALLALPAAGVIGSSALVSPPALALNSPSLVDASPREHLPQAASLLDASHVAARETMSGAAVRVSAAAPQRYREVTLPAGTRLQLRVSSGHSSASSRVEERVNATVVSSVRANGYTAIPAGSRVSGVVYDVERPGKVKGRGRIGLRFNNVTVDGERYPINASYLRVAPATKSSDAKKIGIPAAGGAVIGAILGGKKGALTGAAIGGGAGTAVVLSTRGKDAYIGNGSVVGVTLRRAVTIRVPL